MSTCFSLSVALIAALAAGSLGAETFHLPADMKNAVKLRDNQFMQVGSCCYCSPEMMTPLHTGVPEGGGWRQLAHHVLFPDVPYLQGGAGMFHSAAPSYLVDGRQ